MDEVINMSYWEDIESYEIRNHNRLIEYTTLKHKCRMEEIEKEVELYKLKEKSKDE